MKVKNCTGRDTINEFVNNNAVDMKVLRDSIDSKKSRKNQTLSSGVGKFKKYLEKYQNTGSVPS